MPPAKKAPYHHGDLRRALIREALALVAEKGVAGLTLRETARRAGGSQAAPYRHFPGKEALGAAGGGGGGGWPWLPGRPCTGWPFCWWTACSPARAWGPVPDGARTPWPPT